MNVRKIAILSLAFLLPFTLEAQKKRKRVVKKPVVEEPQEDPRITNMREMTQQILIIDSIVTEKDRILPHLRLSTDVGNLMTTSDFMGKSVQGYTFVNEMGNKAYFSQPDDSMHLQLFTSDLLGDEWSRAQMIQGINDGITEASYPFMLTDGITLYFAGQGEESIGGYDIFFTRYDSHSGRFLQPENLGMPFNSEANDYLYAIDEYNQIGYFVSDRRQPEGKVCIYIFVPSDSRKTYDSSAYTEQQMRDLADITRIADTWGNGTERKAAIARLNAIDTHTSGGGMSLQSSKYDIQLIINDALTYSSAKDFRSPEAAKLYNQLIVARQQLVETNEQLEKSRNYYAKASQAEKQALRKEILKAEKEVLQLNSHIQSLEKQTRRAEIKVIN